MEMGYRTPGVQAQIEPNSPPVGKSVSKGCRGQDMLSTWPAFDLGNQLQPPEPQFSLL